LGRRSSNFGRRAAMDLIGKSPEAEEKGQKSPGVSLQGISPGGKEREERGRTIMERIMEAEKVVLDSARFSSDEEEEEDEKDLVTSRRKDLEANDKKNESIERMEDEAFSSLQSLNLGGSSAVTMSIDSTIAKNIVDSVVPSCNTELIRAITSESAETKGTEKVNLFESENVISCREGPTTDNKTASDIQLLLARSLDASVPLDTMLGDTSLISAEAADTSLTSQASEHSFSTTDIPTLPSGEILTLTILSTWGDPHYVGLSGIEVFNSEGYRIRLDSPKESVTASPHSVNILEGGDGHDPRTPDKLFDGVCHTTSDLHTWLTPWNLDGDNKATVTIDLGEDTTVSMIRIWNYNKSRQHSYRGARLVKLELDGVAIFCGEIRKAGGKLDGPDEASDAVLFTTKEEIVRRIEEGDEMDYPEFRRGMGGEEVSETLVQRIRREREMDRPRTMESGRDGVSPTKRKRRTRRGRQLPDVEETTFEETRPKTGRGNMKTKAEERMKTPSDDSKRHFEEEEEKDPSDDDNDDFLAEADALGLVSPISKSPLKKNSSSSSSSACSSPSSLYPETEPTSAVLTATQALNETSAGPVKTFTCSSLVIKIHSTYEGRLDGSSSKYVGLSGLRFVTHSHKTGQFEERKVRIDKGDKIDAMPRDLNQLGYTGDRRCLENLYSINSDCGNSSDKGRNTINDGDMWLVPDSISAGVEGADGSVTITMHFGAEVVELWGVQVWNYNKVQEREGEFDADTFDEDSLRGGRVVSVSLFGSDGNEVVGAGGGYVLRRGPSCGEFNFMQTLELAKPHATEEVDLLNEISDHRNAKILRQAFKVNSNKFQDYETPFLPCGQLVKIVIHSSWGDPYYVGLNSIEMLDVKGNIIGVKSIGACPSDLSSIGMKDGRVADNLISGNSGGWLAPLVASLPKSESRGVAPGHSGENVIFLCFDKPEHIAACRLRNYERTPNRGVRDLSLWVDGAIVYRGFMNRAETSSHSGRGHVILFSGINEVLNRVGVTKENRKSELTYCGGDCQDVLCIDETVVRERAKFMNEPPDPCAEGVQADIAKRPKTGSILSRER